MKINVKLINNGIMPIFKREGDACLDCYANEDVSIVVGKRGKVHLGFCIEIPDGYEGLIRPTDWI